MNANYKFLFAFLLLLLPVDGRAAAASATRSEDPNSAIVKITATVQTPDFDSPWKFNRSQTTEHMGIVVAPNRVLVTARAVGYATMLTLERFGLDHKVPMVVDTVDYAVNLALLKPMAETLNWNPKPMVVADEMDLEDKPTLYAAGRQRPTPISGFVRDYTLRQSGTSSYSIPFYSMEVRSTSGLGWSEPVILSGKLAGIAAGQSQNTIYVIPPKIIRHFLTDALSGNYRGFGRLGFNYKRLVDPTMQRYYGLKEGQSGVLITDVSEQSPFWDTVKVGDILTQVDHTPITINGYYKHKKWGYVDFVDKIVDYSVGDDLTLNLLRQGEVVTVSAVMTRYLHTDDYIHKYRYEDEPYVVFGGLVFQELSQGYLEAWGADWAQKAPAELLFMWQYNNKMKKDKSKKVIVLGKVLADSFNQGYQQLADAVVSSINGQPVESLDNVKEAFMKPETSASQSDAGGLATIKFAWESDMIILGYKGVAEAHSRMQKTYGLSGNTHFVTPPPAKTY